MDKITLHRVRYLPKDLEFGILYVSEEFGIAGHLCPCGCSNKIMTPLGPTEWSFNEVDGKPTLLPSIGNWQIPCRSHYWIIKGVIEWSYQWSEKQILVGRQAEEMRRQLYYDKLGSKGRKRSIVSRILNWLSLK